MGGGNSHQRAVDRAAKARSNKQQFKDIAPPKDTPRDTDAMGSANKSQRGHLNIGDSIGIVSLVFAVVAVVVTPPLWLKALLLLVSSAGCFAFFNKSDWTHSWRWECRYGGASVAVAILAFIVIPQFRMQWRHERAAQTEGYLEPDPIDAGKHAASLLRIGDSHGALDYAGDPDTPFLQFLYDAGLRLKVENDVLKISTPIRDRLGHLVVNIKENHWWVNPSPEVSVDKNYNQHALEVKDARGHIILQIRLLHREVQLQGEWRDEFGHGVRLIKDSSKPGGDMTIWYDSEAEQRLEQDIPPMFEYPSSEHGGQLLVKNH